MTYRNIGCLFNYILFDNRKILVKIHIMYYNIGDFLGGIIVVLEYVNEYKREIGSCINDLKSKDTVYKQIPNLLTFLRLVGGIPAGLLYLINPYLSIGMITVLWFTDAIDGRIAKKYNIQSKLGADMDTIADKIMFLGTSLPLMANIPYLIINFIFEGIISLINVFGRMKGLDTRTVLSGKIKTISLAMAMVYGYFVQFFGMSFSILNLLISLTTGLQLISIKDYVSEYNRLSEIKGKEEKIVRVNTVCQDENKLDKENTKDDIRTVIDELRYERDLLESMSEEDKVSVNKRCRKK